MNKKKTTLVVALVILGVAVLGLAAAVYAKYVATLTGNSGNISVAKWAFSGENSGSGLITCTPNAYNTTKLSAGKIAPGAAGVCTISVTNEQSDVGVHYTITLGDVANKPTYLEFFEDESHSTPLTANGIEGTINANDSTAQEKTIYWYWPYETTDGDDEDTTDGENAENMTITFSINGEQVQPTN
jgi:hypothetical protein